MASTVRCSPAKVVFSQALNCMLVELMGDGAGPEESSDLSSGPRRISSSSGLSRSPGGASSSGNSTPRLSDAGSDSPSSLAAAGRTPLRSKAASFVPVAASEFVPMKAPPGLEAVKAVTTLMLRNLPPTWSRDTLAGLLDSKGFSGQYDFLYLPTNIKVQMNVGYSFINLTSLGAAKRFTEVFHGLGGCCSSPDKTLEVCLSEVQGLDANIRRYQNSPIMGESVPEEYKPVLFRDGHRVPFPAPTTKLKSLRLRVGKKQQESARPAGAW